MGAGCRRCEGIPAQGQAGSAALEAPPPGPALREAGLRSDRDRGCRKAAPRGELSSESRSRAAGAAARPLAHASLSFPGSWHPRNDGYQGHRFRNGLMLLLPASPSPPAGSASSRLRLHSSLKVHKVRIAQGAGDSRLSVSAGHTQPPPQLPFISQRLECQTSPRLGNYSQSQALRNVPRAR